MIEAFVAANAWFNSHYARLWINERPLHQGQVDHHAARTYAVTGKLWLPERAGADAPGEGDYSSHRRAGHLDCLAARL